MFKQLIHKRIFKNILSDQCHPRSLAIVRNFSAMPRNTHRVNNFEKRLLVWTKKYKNIEDVPALISQETIEKARNVARIRFANIMIAGTILGCIIMIISGKRAAERGETVQRANLDWHKQMNQDVKSQ